MLLALMSLTTTTFSQLAYKRALRKYDHGKYDVALKRANRILQRDPADKDALLLKYVSLDWLDRYDEPIEPLMGLKAYDASVMQLIGRVYREREEYDSALHFIKLSETDDKVSYYNDLGTVYLDMGDLDSAIYYFEQASQADPMIATPYVNAGKSYYENDELYLACPNLYVASILGDEEATAHLEELNCNSWQDDWMDWVEGEVVESCDQDDKHIINPLYEIYTGVEYELKEGRQRSIVSVEEITRAKVGHILKLKTRDGSTMYRAIIDFKRPAWQLRRLKETH